jgi:hypothetical protein
MNKSIKKVYIIIRIWNIFCFLHKGKMINYQMKETIFCVRIKCDFIKLLKVDYNINKNYNLFINGEMRKFYGFFGKIITI